MYFNTKSTLDENFSLTPTKVPIQQFINKNCSKTLIFTQGKYSLSNINTKQKFKPVSKSLLAYVSQGLCFSNDVTVEVNKDTNDYEANLIKITKQSKDKTTVNRFEKIEKPEQKFSKQNVSKSIKLKNFEKKCLENIWTKTKLGGYEKSKVCCSGTDKPNKSTSKTIFPNHAKSKKPSIFWNDVLIKNLSGCSLKKIYESPCTTAYDKLKLEKIINDLFHLNEENVSNDTVKIEEVDDEETRKIKLKILKDQQKLKEKANRESCLKNDPILVKTLAEYYRLPKYFKDLKLRKEEHTENFNNTCKTIKINDDKDLMSEKLKQKFSSTINSNHMLKSKNEYEAKLVAGVKKQVYSKEKTTVLLQDKSKYKLKLQETYPKEPKDYTLNYDKVKINMTKGALRWSSLPKRIDEHQNLMFSPNNIVDTDFDQPNSDAECFYGKKIDDITLVSCLEMWRQKWSMSNRWHDLKLADILIDLNSIHNSVRLAAMAACLVASLYFIPNQHHDIAKFGREIKMHLDKCVWSETISKVYEQSSITSVPKQNLTTSDTSYEWSRKNVGHLPAPLLRKISEMMTSDSHERVRLTACMCLHVCGHEELQITQILQYHIQNGLPSDQLVAGQIVALRGIPSTKVVQQMVNMLIEGDNEYEQASKLLIHLSQFTRLVHSLLAEQLNSSNYKVRAAVCSVLCQTRGEINHDLVNKLKKMMSQDWSSQSRNYVTAKTKDNVHSRTKGNPKM